MLNQVEFRNQSPITGSWKFEYGKDTTGYMDCTTYGTGLFTLGPFSFGGAKEMKSMLNKKGALLRHPLARSQIAAMAAKGPACRGGLLIKKKTRIS